MSHVNKEQRAWPFDEIGIEADSCQFWDGDLYFFLNCLLMLRLLSLSARLLIKTGKSLGVGGELSWLWRRRSRFCHNRLCFDEAARWRFLGKKCRNCLKIKDAYDILRFWVDFFLKISLALPFDQFSWKSASFHWIFSSLDCVSLGPKQKQTLRGDAAALPEAFSRNEFKRLRISRKKIFKMSVVIETTKGNFTVDLYVEQRPKGNYFLSAES